VYAVWWYPWYWWRFSYDNQRDTNFNFIFTLHFNFLKSRYLLFILKKFSFLVWSFSFLQRRIGNHNLIIYQFIIKEELNSYCNLYNLPRCQLGFLKFIFTLHFKSSGNIAYFCVHYNFPRCQLGFLNFIFVYKDFF
jgi:hypothetical protein